MKPSYDKTKINEIKSWLGTGSINIFGMPLSGKDTQCNLLAEILQANTFGGGDILRTTKVSNKLKTDIDNGFLAPTEEYVQKIIPYFSKREYNDKPLVLSSVGRWIGEEKSVLKAAKDCNHPIKAVVFLKLSHQVIIDRNKLAKRGRVDDDISKLENRFSEYKIKTFPVLEEYKKLELLVEIDGNQSESKVTHDILDAIYTKVKEN